MKRYAILGATLIALGGAGSLAAQETPEPQPERPQARQRLHAPGTGLAERAFAPRALIQRRTFLGLSDQQVADLEKLQAQVQTAREKALTDAETHREALAQAWNADKPDARAVREHATALMRVQQEAQLEALGAAARAKSMLTPEQLGKVRGLQEGHRARAGVRGRAAIGRGMRGMPRSPRSPRPGVRPRFRRPDLL